MSESLSRIIDTDMGSQTMSLFKAQVLMQASISMFVQANSNPNAVLQLLK